MIPQRLCALGRAARRWRAAGEGVRPVVRRAAAVLAIVHGARSGASGPGAGACRLRRVAGATAGPRRGRRARLGHPGRRRAGRSRTADAARRARAAIGRRDPVRRSGVAPDVLDFARREAKKMLVGKTGHGPSCKQDEINALMIALAAPASAWCGSRAATR